MATPPPTPQSTNTTTGAAGSRSQPPVTTPALNIFFRHCCSQLKPWSELIDRNSLSRPGTLSEAYSRILHNLSYFRHNYVTVTAITLALSLLTHPFSLIILGLFCYGIILCLFHPSDQPLVLFGSRTFSISEIHGLLVIFALYLTSVGPLLISGLMVGFAVVCAHGAFRVVPDEDLFLDAYDQDAEFETNLIFESKDEEPSDAEFNTNLISVPNISRDAEFNQNLISMPNIISSSPPPTKYDVFLSFRGEDTRYSFASHLCTELCRKNIQTYMDDNLGKGENISPALRTAIEESKIYVIIFSKNYASSRWCLDELTNILECQERYGRAVIPIFYNVDPSVVRYQGGSYGVAFLKHEGRYKDKVQGWKAALTHAAGLSGWNSNAIK
ncbi:hypothetical protein RIF29_35059 [Crotalaria pallida]|uniref:TIR domain-containing protein n=1 Tax=Crotalaria pallida TaxID=3830 RepID=A0AAN9EFA5_CROPI